MRPAVRRLAVAPALGALEDEQSAAARRTPTFVSPAGHVVAAHFAPAALAPPWLTGSLVGSSRQWAVNRFVPSRAGAATA